MSIYALMGAIEIGLIYGFVALGVAITFRILDFPDLTVDGSFPLGAAVSAVFITTGGDAWISIIIAFFAGCVAGSVTAWLNIKFKILHLLASILVMVALYSINLRIMGKPNIPLIGEKTILHSISDVIEPLYARPLLIAILIVIAYLATVRILLSKFGLAIRATGNNTDMAKAQGINTNANTLYAVAASNGLAAIGGALFAQMNGFADASLGTGTIIVGLASVIIGQSLLPNAGIALFMLAVIFGSIFYRLAISIALNSDALGLEASDLNLVTAIIVAMALILPKINKNRRS